MVALFLCQAAATIMPLPTTGEYALSAQDVVSFAFGKPDYDLDRPVSL